jgi:hypothetical protein
MNFSESGRGWGGGFRLKTDMDADTQETELDLFMSFDLVVFWDISSWALQLQLMGSKACVLSFLSMPLDFPTILF